MSNKAGLHGVSEEVVQAEHMKMALRAESSQAARILKGWLAATTRLLRVAKEDSTVPPAYKDLRLVLGIWEIHTMDSDDSSGASADQFSAECLIPLLILHNQLSHAADRTPTRQSPATLLRQAIESLEALLSRHLFGPARTAFFADAKVEGKTVNAKQLASYLEPLRAKLLQAAQIQDTSSPIPAFFMPLFEAIPHLLDLAVRISPSRTPKNRITERPWLQAVLVALLECAGCPLEEPKYIVPKASITAAEKSLKILSLYDVKVDSGVLADLFWYHSGVNFRLNQEREIHWSLIAALIKLDPDTFVSGSTHSSADKEGRPEDLSQFLFDHISSASFQEPSLPDGENMVIDSVLPQSGMESVESASSFTVAGNNGLLKSVVVPIMTAYARSRDLLGFIHRWDAQLCENAPVTRKAFATLQASVWEDQGLALELESLLEKSLTGAQILNLFQLHAGRVKPLKAEERGVHDDSSADTTDSIKKAYSSTVILRAILWSINSDETIESLQPLLTSLLSSYTDLVCDKFFRTRTDPASCWTTLCRLLVMLWPLQIHSSLESQKQLLTPLVNQAMEDVSATRKKKDEHPVDSKTRAAALLFLLTASNHLRTVPGWDDTLCECVRKSLKTLSSTKLEPTEFGPMLEVFAVEFPQLLEYLEPDTREDYLVRLLTKISELERETARRIVAGLSQHIFSSASSVIRDAYPPALLAAVSQAQGNEDESLLGLVKTALLQIRPSAIPRERREAILNRVISLISSTEQDAELSLSVANSLQEVPNATAKISSDSSIIFHTADLLHDQKLESPSVLRLFQELVRKTLGHMLPNRDQAQNKKYLERFQKKLSSILKKADDCFPARLAIIRATFLAQNDIELVPWDKYLAVLAGCLVGPSAFEEASLAALLELPVQPDGPTEQMFRAVHTLIQGRLNATMRLETHQLEERMFNPTVSADRRVILHGLISKFRLYPDLKWLIELSIRLLRDVGQEYQLTILKAVEKACSSVAAEERLRLIPFVTPKEEDGDQSATYRLLQVLTSTLDDKLAEDPEQKTQQLTLLPAVCELLSETSNSSSFSALQDTVDTIIRDKPAFTSQYSIECLLTVLSKLSSRQSPHLRTSDAPAIYSRLCETTRFILLLHRSRLGGRFHLLLPILQNLLFCLFIPHAGRHGGLPSWLRTTPTTTTQTRLTPTNASQYNRLLSTLCSPTQSSVSKPHHHRASKSKSNIAARATLNDPVKAAREYVSHYIYPLLASFCRFQLNGRLDSGVREKLMPGLWEVVGTAEMDRDALQAMFAGLDKSSREIWKGVWEEWKRMHGRGKAV
jgi:nucleolar pre-ribosomal-associated protein 2